MPGWRTPMHLGRTGRRRGSVGGGAVKPSPTGIGVVSKKRTTRAAETLSWQGLTLFLIASRPKLETANGAFLDRHRETSRNRVLVMKNKRKTNGTVGSRGWSSEEIIHVARDEPQSRMCPHRNVRMYVGSKTMECKICRSGSRLEHRVRFLFFSFSRSPLVRRTLLVYLFHPLPPFVLASNPTLMGSCRRITLLILLEGGRFLLRIRD